jgi:hypothetical protein
MAFEDKYCPNCGAVEIPMSKPKGSGLVNFILFLFFIIPGVLYFVWRMTTYRDVCPKCGAEGVIPTDSPRAREAIRSRQPIAAS